MKAEKGSEIITTICEYENSVAMPDNERLTYLDTCGISLKASLTSRLIDFKYLREAEAPAYTHGVPNDIFDYEFDDDDIPAFSFPEA